MNDTKTENEVLRADIAKLEAQLRQAEYSSKFWLEAAQRNAKAHYDAETRYTAKLQASEAGAAALREALVKFVDTIIMTNTHVNHQALCDLNKARDSSTAGADMLAEVERLRSHSAHIKQKERAEKAEKRVEHLEAVVQSCRDVGVDIVYTEPGKTSTSNVRALRAENEIEGHRAAASVFAESEKEWKAKALAAEKERDALFTAHVSLVADLGAALKERDQTIRAFNEIGKSARRIHNEGHEAGFNECREKAAWIADNTKWIDDPARKIRALKPEPKAAKPTHPIVATPDLSWTDFEPRSFDILAALKGPPASTACTCKHGADWHTSYAGCGYESSDRFGDHICPCEFDGKEVGQ